MRLEKDEKYRIGLDSSESPSLVSSNECIGNELNTTQPYDILDSRAGNIVI